MSLEAAGGMLLVFLLGVALGPVVDWAVERTKGWHIMATYTCPHCQVLISDGMLAGHTLGEWRRWFKVRLTTITCPTLPGWTLVQPAR